MAPAPVAAPKATPRAAAPAVIAGPILGPEPPAPTSRSKVPDFVRPNTDERYFKQLKRF
jgi:hypothetical protein